MVTDLPDEIENKILFLTLITADRHTIQIVLLSILQTELHHKGFLLIFSLYYNNILKMNIYYAIL